MKLGITQYAACPEGTEGKKLLEHVTELGLEGVEPFFGDPDAELLTLHDNQAQQMATAAKELDIRIPSTALGAFNIDPSLIDGKGTDKAIDLIKKALKRTAVFGGDIMLLCTFLSSHPDTPQKKNNLLKVLHQVEPIADDLGITIALETPLPACELTEIIESADSELVKVYYDLGNAVALGFDPVAEIETLADKIIDVHIKDSLRGTLGAVHLGKGDLDLASSIAALKKVNYDGWLILETPLESDSRLRSDIEILRKLI